MYGSPNGRQWQRWRRRRWRHSTPCVTVTSNGTSKARLTLVGLFHRFILLLWNTFSLQQLWVLNKDHYPPLPNRLTRMTPETLEKHGQLTIYPSTITVQDPKPTENWPYNWVDHTSEDHIYIRYLVYYRKRGAGIRRKGARRQKETLHTLKRQSIQQVYNALRKWKTFKDARSAGGATP